MLACILLFVVHNLAFQLSERERVKRQYKINFIEIFSTHHRRAHNHIWTRQWILWHFNFLSIRMVGSFVLWYFWILFDRIDLNYVSWKFNKKDHFLRICYWSVGTTKAHAINHSLCCVLFTLPAVFISVFLFASWQLSILSHFLIQFWWYIVQSFNLRKFSLRRSVQCKCLALTYV